MPAQSPTSRRPPISYQAGDGLSDTGGGWVSLFSSDGRYDIPFRTMITPATEVAFLNRRATRSTSTVLNDGRVLLTGNGNTADIYDPVTRTIAPTGNMITPRSNHTATLLPTARCCWLADATSTP